MTPLDIARPNDDPEVSSVIAVTRMRSSAAQLAGVVPDVGGQAEGVQAGRDRRLERFRWAFLMLGDVASVCVSVGLGWMLSGLLRTSFDLPVYMDTSVARTLALMLCFPVAIQLWLSYRWGHYSRFKSFWIEVGELTKMTAFSAALGSCMLFLLRMHFSRLWVLATLGCLLLINPLTRTLVRRVMAAGGFWFRPLVVVGTSERALESAEALCHDLSMGYRVAAFVKLRSAWMFIDPGESFRPGFLSSFEAFRAVEDVARNHRAPHVLYAMDSMEDFSYYTVLFDRLTMNSENVIVAPPITGIPLSGIELVGVAGHDTVMLRLDNNLRKRPAQLLKRLFDLSVAGTLLTMLSPLLLSIWLRLRYEGGSPIFAHERIGRGGRPFGCLKFRTMVTNADEVLRDLLARDEHARAEWARDFKLREDPRITPLGHFLRRTNLDELPQLLNVLKGEMSLVGPRPIVSVEVDRYGEKFAYYSATWPGMTGLWQTSGRNDLSYAERVELDVRYVRNWSLWQDIVMLLRTCPLFVRTKGAY